MGHVNGLDRFLVQTPVPHRTGHANDRVPGLVTLWWSKSNAFAEWAGAGPVLAGQTLIDDRYARGPVGVRIGKVAALSQTGYPSFGSSLE